MGTTKGGNRLPGVVAAPFAMTKLGPDVQNDTAAAHSGYLPDDNIWGFSMMHESGTGGYSEVCSKEMTDFGPVEHLSTEWFLRGQ